ncbi:MAG: serine--tRNA ligase [Candidatus Doudnabacteria bacterium]|nr:serine--tRNA ligase [Candidatus Doudnabacteria bacterium]
MLDIKYIRENKDLVEKNSASRGVKVDIAKLLELDEKRRKTISEIDELRSQRKQGSKGKPSEDDIVKMREVGDKIQKMEKSFADLEAEYLELLLKVPNLTHPESPLGGEGNYKVTYTNWEPQDFTFKPKDHEQLMENLDLIDFERGAKVATSKFYFAKNDLVRLNQALINYGIDVVTRHGYSLLETPDLARNEILQGIGFNPRGDETQVYSIENTDLSLIATAEITVGGFHANEVVDLSKGPLKYIALSHCYRTEAGAYGRTSKGLYRVHQFTKLEMFVYCAPEDSEKMHQELLAIEQEIANGLELPYRVIDIPSEDLGAPAYRKFDIEAWMTMKGEGEKQGDYGEVTSTSNCTDYQARRLNIKYKKPDGSHEFVHTLNGTAVVLSRFPIAIFENHQQENGSIKIPKTLQPYFGKDKIEK